MWRCFARWFNWSARHSTHYHLDKHIFRSKFACQLRHCISNGACKCKMSWWPFDSRLFQRIFKPKLNFQNIHVFHEFVSACNYFVRCALCCAVPNLHKASEWFTFEFSFKIWIQSYQSQRKHWPEDHNYHICYSQHKAESTRFWI